MWRHTQTLHALKDTNTLRVSHAHSEREKNAHTLIYICTVRDIHSERERHRY